MRAGLERGYWCFGLPAAYRYIKSREHGKIISPIEPAASIIAEGITGYATDRLRTQSDVLRFFQERDLYTVLNRNRKHLDLDFIKDVLTQPLYAGFVELKCWGVARRKGQHQSIISEETFFANRKKLANAERKTAHIEKPNFPLRRLIVCAVCGRKMTGSTCKGKNKYYSHYTCNNKQCTANPKNISVEKLEREYVVLLDSIRVDQEILQMGTLIATRIWENKMKHVSNNESQREADRHALEKKIDEYIELVPAAPSLSIKARYEAKIAELDQQVQVLDSSPETQKAPDFDEALSLTLRLLGTPSETWIYSDTQAKVVLHNLIFTEKLSYSVNTGFGTPKLSLPFLLKELVPASKGEMVDLAGVEPASERRRTVVDERKCAPRFLQSRYLGQPCATYL